MFIGHFAVAFAAKRAAPRTSLGTTFVAAQFADLLWPLLLLFGWEQVRIAPNQNPFLTLEFTNYPWSHGLVTELVWGAAFGVLEGIVFVAGVAVYARATRPLDRAGRYGLWGLVAFLVLLYVVSSVSPPPPSVKALAWAALIGWPLTLWPWWVDRHRR
jgi:hypothetical protein